MIYPDFLKKGDTVAVTAVSDGVDDELDKVRFNNGKAELEKRGYKVYFSDDVFKVDKWMKSAPGDVRGKEFNDIFSDDNVKYVVSAKGGNFLCEMLEYIDFEKIKLSPKWFQGYSDNTSVVHAITTKLDIASVYGSNFGEFGMENYHESVENNLKILEGNLKAQNSFDMYQKEQEERITGLEGYKPDTKVIYTPDSITEKKGDSAEFSGRLLGGCLDVLEFIQGTKYDNTLEFIDKYKKDGIIWYLESFDTSGETLTMFLWQLKEIGWFKYTKGFIFGRPLFYRSFIEADYREIVEYSLGDLDVPMIFDWDFGHIGPRMTMINGAYATVKYKEGKGSVSYDFV